jgi:hypothetical protein
MWQELVEFVSASALNCLLPYKVTPEAIGWNVSESQIRRALQKEGFHYCMARMKPPISETNWIAQLEWARAHVHWTEEH